MAWTRTDLVLAIAMLNTANRCPTHGHVELVICGECLQEVWCRLCDSICQCWNDE